VPAAPAAVLGVSLDHLLPDPIGGEGGDPDDPRIERRPQGDPGQLRVLPWQGLDK
jgi:hypothetical protein